MDKKSIQHLKEVKILYVEDNLDIREEIEFFLSNKVAKLYIAENGEEGYELFKEYSPDLIVTDIQMPIMNGIDMIRKIRDDGSNIPIVVVTAFNDTDYLQEGIKLHVTSYLTKPINLFLLVETLVKISKEINLEKDNQRLLNMLKQYKDIVDESTIVSKANKDGVITYVNKPFEDITGYTKEELYGNTHSIIKHPETKIGVFQDIYKHIKKEKKLWHGRLRNRRKNGKDFYVDILIKPILDLNGEILEFISLSTDITDLQKSKIYFENQIHRTNIDLDESVRIATLYKNVLQDSNIIIRIDLDKKISFVNELFYKILGFEKNDLLGKPYSLLGDISSSQEDIDKYFTDSKWIGKISNYSKDGKKLSFNSYIYPLKNKDDEIVEYMEIRHDITQIESLHKELEETQKEIIYKLGEVAETRSGELGYHVKRVAEYSKLLAKKINLSQEEIRNLFMASPMHDIGKIGIPDSILNKPSSLDEDEWEIMKTHSEIGYDILKNSKREILKTAAIISYSHHEKWNGSGYPLGLEGEQIHIFGRISAIADVFDALGTNRVYKKAWSLEKILAYFNAEKGKHFDPELIDIFMENLDEFLLIRDKYKDE